jgi:solute carrier family 35 protein C2
MFVTLFLLAVPVEGMPSFVRALAALSVERGGALGAAAILLFPGCLAFLMTVSEFALLQRTSVVTLSICGILKEVLTISAASIVFHDEISTINGVGLLITIATIAAYNYIKITKMREDAASRAHAAFELGSASGGSAADSAYLPVPSDDLDAGDPLRVVLPVANGSAAAGDAPKLSPIKRPEDRV